MMTKFTAAFLTLVFGILTASAQHIKFEKSFSAAQSKARSQNKPLFVIVSITPTTPGKTYMQGMEDPEVIRTVNQSFTAYKVDLKDTAARKLAITYKLTSFPAFIFLDSSGALLFKSFGSFATPNRYLDMLSKAIFASKQTPMADLDSRYREGYRDAGFLKEYILRRKSAGITNNAKLIDEYVNYLKIADLSKFDELLFILEAGPTAQSKAYKSTLLDKKMIDSVYKTIPSAKRGAIYNTIANNSLAEAIEAKSFQNAMYAAEYRQRTISKDYRLASKMHTLTLLQYYRGVNDTSGYLRNAVSYYDQHYMNISIDSIKRLDIKNRENLNKFTALQKAKADSLNIETGTVLIATSESTATFAKELNNAAWNFYTLGTKNPGYLTKAVLWSKRSIALKPAAAHYDTLAHLLYRLGFYSEAENTQTTAIQMAKAEKRESKSLEEELQKIRSKTL